MTDRRHTWINPDGYDCNTVGYRKQTLIQRLLRWRTMLYRLELDACGPLSFLQADGRLMRMGKELTHTPMVIDLGSIPPVFTRRYPPDQYERAYMHHDYVCRKHGLWVFIQGKDEWEWCPLVRREADILLRCMVEAEQKYLGLDPRRRQQRHDRRVIYWAVCIGARFMKNKPNDSTTTEGW